MMRWMLGVGVVLVGACCLAAGQGGAVQPSGKSAGASTAIPEVPRISIQVKHATLEQVVEALNKEMGAAMPPGFLKVGVGAVSGDFTLNLQNRTFWEVVHEMQAQFPLLLNTSSKEFRMEQGTLGMPAFEPSGIVVGIPMQMTRSRTLDTQAAPEETALISSVTVRYKLMLDPHFRLLRFETPVIEKLRDEQGREMPLIAMPRPMPILTLNGHVNVMSNSLQFAYAEKDGKKFSASGSVRLTVSVEDVSGVIEDLPNSVGKSISVGNREITVRRMTLQKESLALILDAPGEAGELMYTGLDKSGQVFWRMSAPAMLNTAVSVANFEAPFRIQARVPKHAVDLVCAFQLKDIQVP